MRRLCAAFASITLASIIALSTLNHANAGGGCPLFEIMVSREGSIGGGFVCHVRGVVGWLQVYSGAAPQARIVRRDTSSDSRFEAWWFRLVVRAVLAVLAFLMLRLSADQLRTLSLGHSVDLRFDTTLWLERSARRSLPASSSDRRPGFPSPRFASCQAVSYWPLPRSCPSLTSDGASSRVTGIRVDG